MKFNKRLLKKVRDYILAEPRRLDMNTLGDWVDPNDKSFPPCGTVGCIAGWAAVLSAPKKEISTPEDRASVMTWKNGQKALGLDYSTAHRLFKEPRFARIEGGEGSWPIKFANRYLRARTPRQRAKVTAERIDHFIATNGAE